MRTKGPSPAAQPTVPRRESGSRFPVRQTLDTGASAGRSRHRCAFAAAAPGRRPSDRPTLAHAGASVSMLSHTMDDESGHLRSQRHPVRPVPSACPLAASNEDSRSARRHHHDQRFRERGRLGGVVQLADYDQTADQQICGVKLSTLRTPEKLCRTPVYKLRARSASVYLTCRYSKPRATAVSVMRLSAAYC